MDTTFLRPKGRQSADLKIKMSKVMDYFLYRTEGPSPWSPGEHQKTITTM